ncbi:MAG: dihydroorotate dehydrogenase-like protein [Anaerolineae bacterium]|nr:dihydroorotate dehydrogenase-like protein [Anaerolineae bacterium]
MDTRTSYLGLELKHPIMPSASPLSRSIDTIRRLEDNGAAAVVMHSLFEEQITLESEQLDHYLSYFTDAFAEALSWYPEQQDYRVGPEEYLDNVRRAKEAVDIPIIGSLNGISTGGWIDYAEEIEQAGADALELNVYYIPGQPDVTAADVEELAVAILRAVKESVSIPVAMKLSPYYSSLPHLAQRLVEAGADGLLLFNRFYQPDFDLEAFEVVPSLTFSTSDELRLPLRWVAILYGRMPVDLGITTGVHTHLDVIKGLMAGARVTMMASELLQNGVERIQVILDDVVAWMGEHEYESVAQMQGSMSQKNVADPAAFERANYMKVLQSWRPDPAGQLYRELVR